MTQANAFPPKADRMVESLKKSSAVLVTGLLVLSILLLLVKPVISIPVLAPKDYNEGWNAYQSMRAFGAERLYPDPQALIANNYPPVSFYVVGAFGSLIGDHIVAGRWIALFSLLVVAAGIAAIVWHLCKSRYAAIFSGLIFLGYIGLVHPLYIGMDDPQWLAQAIMIIAFFLFASGNIDSAEASSSACRLLPPALLILVAGMTKHTLLALPFAITAWFLLHDRRKLVAWLTVSGLLLCACLAGFYFFYGREFFYGVFEFPREYSRSLIPVKLRQLLPMTPMFAALLVFLILEPNTRRKHFVLLYVVCSGALGAFALGGRGVDINVMYDFIVGLAIVAGLTVYRIGERLGKAWPGGAVEACCAVLVSIGFLAALPRHAVAAQHAFADIEGRRELAAADIRFIADVDGPVMCETLALCYWAGKPFEVDVFALGQKLRSGVLSEDEFDRLLDSRYFAAIQLHVPEPTPRLPKATNDAIRRDYDARPSSLGGIFLVPRASPK